jgi:hypothetical protein
MKIQQHLTTEWPVRKELEEQSLRTLQKVFVILLAALLEVIDQQLAEARNKHRYQLKDKRPTKIQTLFGEVTFRWNDYYEFRGEMGGWRRKRPGLQPRPSQLGSNRPNGRQGGCWRM